MNMPLLKIPSFLFAINVFSLIRGQHIIGSDPLNEHMSGYKRFLIASAKVLQFSARWQI